MQFISSEEKLVELRELFHEFQTSVLFSTTCTASEIFANHLKCYEFLNELERHFVCQKVPQLYEFVHSIFSLMFSMIKEVPSPQEQSLQNHRQSKQCRDCGVQAGICEGPQKLHNLAPNTNFPNSNFQEANLEVKANEKFPHFQQLRMKKKRNQMQIQIFEKDIAEMNQRERRRALKNQRDLIYKEQEVENNDLKEYISEFKPHIQHISASKADDNIRDIIQKFRESDVSTHLFLKHFLEDLFPDETEEKQVKGTAELLSSDNIKAIIRLRNNFKQFKNVKSQKLTLRSRVIEESYEKAHHSQDKKKSSQTDFLNNQPFSSSKSLINCEYSLKKLINEEKLFNQSQKSIDSIYKRTKSPSILLKPIEEIQENASALSNLSSKSILFQSSSKIGIHTDSTQTKKKQMPIRNIQNQKLKKSHSNHLDSQNSFKTFNSRKLFYLEGSTAISMERTQSLATDQLSESPTDYVFQGSKVKKPSKWAKPFQQNTEEFLQKGVKSMFGSRKIIKKNQHESVNLNRQRVSKNQFRNSLQM